MNIIPIAIQSNTPITLPAKLTTPRASMQGFTLIELMIVIVIIGVLAAIGYPAYTQQVQESQRAEGTVALLDFAARQERFFTANGRYASDINAEWGVNNAAPTSETGIYTISVNADAGVNFELTATLTDNNANDATCGNLMLDNAGVRGIDVNGDGSMDNGVGAVVAECWQ